jgi:hypothetical protein
MRRLVMKTWFAVTYLPAVLFILSSDRHELGTLRKLWVGWRMLRTTVRVQAGTGPKTHLAMALKILETPRSVEGVVVECGAWKGASTANLSVACKIAGRRWLCSTSSSAFRRRRGWPARRRRMSQVTTTERWRK